MPPAPPTSRLARTAADLLAGLSVALMLIPQSLAYAELAGLPPHVGLIAAALPPILAGFFASSVYLQPGPTAMASLLTLAALAPLGPLAPADRIAHAALLALLVGLLRVALGALRAGALAFFLSPTVLAGFTFGAAVLIAASQLPALLGLPPAAPAAGLLTTAATALTTPSAWSPAAAALSAGTLALVLLARRLHPLVPGVLLAVAAGLALSLAGAWHGPVLGPIPATFPAFSLDLPWAALPPLLLPALVIAVLGFAEPVAIARAFPAPDGRPWDPNRELMSQGVANLTAGLTGGLPVGGSFSRSALAHLAGARTRLSSQVTGLATLAFLPVAGALAPLPKPILAALILLAIAKLLAGGRDLLRLFRFSAPQALVAWTTFALTLALAPHVERAVLAGLVLSFVLHAWREMRVRVDAHLDGATLVVAPSGVLWFASAEGLRETIAAELTRAPRATALCVDLAGLGRIDYTGARTLAELATEVRGLGRAFSLAHPPPHALRILGRVCPELLPPEPPAPSPAR